MLDFPEAAAEHYAKIRAMLSLRGEMIGANDLLIGCPRSQGLTLVTNNTREFGRVSGLQPENWTQTT